MSPKGDPGGWMLAAGSWISDAEMQANPG